MAASTGTGGMTPGAARLAATPRSGARPLFGGQQSAPRSAPSPEPAAAKPAAVKEPAKPAARKPAAKRPAKPRAAKPPATYDQHVTRERRRRVQSDYRRQASEQVSRERGERPARKRQSAAPYQKAARQLASGPSMRNYQGIILAEFIAAELLVAATPIAARQNVPGLSPYVPRDMTKLLAIGLVYFLLQLAAVGGQGPGRVCAWLGGLVLLTVGLGEAANVAKDIDLFSPAKKQQQKPEPVTEV